MADTPVVRVEQNGFRNVVIRANCVSDGSGFSGFKIYDATSAGAFGVSAGGQTFYPGVHTTIAGMDFDTQDMKLRVQWDATAPEDIVVWGSSPEGFRWDDIGGLRVPAGLAGATGSILISSIDPQVNATFTLILRLRKNVP